VFLSSLQNPSSWPYIFPFPSVIYEGPQMSCPVVVLVDYFFVIPTLRGITLLFFRQPHFMSLIDFVFPTAHPIQLFSRSSLAYFIPPNWTSLHVSVFRPVLLFPPVRRGGHLHPSCLAIVWAQCAYHLYLGSPL